MPSGANVVIGDSPDSLQSPVNCSALKGACGQELPSATEVLAVLVYVETAPDDRLDGE